MKKIKFALVIITLATIAMGACQRRYTCPTYLKNDLQNPQQGTRS
ncbi:MAG: hypothetical protein SFU27_11950 [Thermonemataceae bacterium]|nr:hypothetical protein [Thermonemataceae bacterium]